MLEIKNIRKEYKTGSYTQQALDDVSLTLRDNEFLFILGPSGSGKTTLLNIIGGLDRYDSGDLIINGVSTKDYTDRDWDTYRNHTIGFVFQSYNLIPHQTVLSNVEIALTIGGVSREERRQRAIQALKEVGLEEHIHKKPNQLSGGQMQRVAIARALVNDPAILLADEPTGALDSDTSIQVMELLKKVAEDRLVVMVTHNPELAEQYATRIVKLRDGKIKSDTDPVTAGEKAKAGIGKAAAAASNMAHAALRLPTAMKLSLQNLWAKRTRTFLVSFAGSIGIIGIALIMALSSGATDYIESIEEDTLSEYPLEVTSTGFDFTSLLSAYSGMIAEEGEETDEDVINVIDSFTNMFSSTSNNDLGALKEYFESGESGIEDYVKAIEYEYDVAPEIYVLDQEGDASQVSPETVSSSFLSSSVTSSSLMSSLSSLGSFNQLPSTSELYEDQYEVMAGHWPENYNECVLVLTSDGDISDTLVYTLGLRDSEELTDMVSQFLAGEDVDVPDIEDTYTYEEIMDISFRLVIAGDYYTYDEEYDIWVDNSDDDDYVQELVENGEELKIVGIVQPTESSSTAVLTTGVYYTEELTHYVVDKALETDVVKAQMDSPKINILTGDKFGIQEDSTLDLSEIFTIDTDAIEEMFSFEDLDLTDALSSVDLTEYIDMDSLDLGDSIDLSSLDLSDIEMDYDAISEAMSEAMASSMNVSASSDFSEALMEDFTAYMSESGSDYTSSMTDGLSEYMESDEAAAIIQSAMVSMMTSSDPTSVIQEMMSDLMEGYQSSAADTVTSMSSLFEEYLSTERAQSVIAAAMSSMIDYDAMSEAMAEAMESVMAEMMTAYTEEITAAITEEMSSVSESMTDEISSSLESAISESMSEISSYMAESISSSIDLDADTLSEMVSMDMESEDIYALISSMSSSSGSSYDDNLLEMGYVDFSDPTCISIYSIDFDSKNEVIEILDNYNSSMLESGDDDKVISYTDVVGTMMSAVSAIIDNVTYLLIAFVAVSLVVSSIMIGVITYISVVERQKEIGILRALGASKHNISQIFNAETLIIGLCAGVLGILISYALTFPINAIIQYFTGTDAMRAVMNIKPSLILILLSVVLTMIGGLIPSKQAANSDPVKALRNE